MDTKTTEAGSNSAPEFHEQSAALLFEKDLARTAKRTVCWTTPDAPTDLRYLKLKRGEKATDKWRAGAAGWVHKKHPDATIWGLPAADAVGKELKAARERGADQAEIRRLEYRLEMARYVGD